MQLLHSSPIPSAEFASLTLLLDPVAAASTIPSDSATTAATTTTVTTTPSSQSQSGGPDSAAGPPSPPPIRIPQCSTPLGDALTVVSPLATTSAPLAHVGLLELHAHLARLVDADSRRNEDRADAEAALRAKRKRKKEKKMRKVAGGGAGGDTDSGGGGGAGSGGGGGAGGGSDNNKRGKRSTVGDERARAAPPSSSSASGPAAGRGNLSDAGLGESVNTIETAASAEDGDDDTVDSVDDYETEGRAREDAAKREEDQAEVLLAMLVAASEEGKKREREKEERKERKERKAAGLVAEVGEVEEDYDDEDEGEEGEGADASESLEGRHERLRNLVCAQFRRDDASLLFGRHSSSGLGLGFGDYSSPSPVQVYRPARSSGGMGLHYVVLRDPALVRRCTDLLLGVGGGGGGGAASATKQGSALRSSKAAAGGTTAKARGSGKGGGAQAAGGEASTKGVTFTDNPDDGVPPPPRPPITAAVLTIGVSGTQCGVGTSDLVSTLPTRFADAVSILSCLGGATALAAGGGGAGTGSIRSKAKGGGGTSTSASTSAGGGHQSAAAIGAEAKKYARSVLSALLLADGDGLTTNASYDAERGVHDEDVLAAGGTGGDGSRRKLRGKISIGGGKYTPTHTRAIVRKKFNFSSDRLKRSSGKASKQSSESSVGAASSAIIPSSAGGWYGPNVSPADVTRIVTEQMQILSLAETDMAIPPYRKRAAYMAGGGGMTNRRKRFGRSGGSALHLAPIDLAAFDYKPPRRATGGGVGGGSRRNVVAPTGPTAATMAMTITGDASAANGNVGAVRAAAAAASAELAASTQSGSLASGIRPAGLSRLSGPKRDTSGVGKKGGRRTSRIGVAPPPRDGRVTRRSVSDSQARRTPRGRQQQQQQQGQPAQVQQHFQGGDDVSGGSRGSHADSLEEEEAMKKKRQPAATFDPFAFNDAGGDSWDPVPDRGRQSSGGGGSGSDNNAGDDDVLDMFGSPVASASASAAAAVSASPHPFQDDAGPAFVPPPQLAVGGGAAAPAPLGEPSPRIQGHRPSARESPTETPRASPPTAEASLHQEQSVVPVTKLQAHSSDEAVIVATSIGVGNIADEETTAVVAATARSVSNQSHPPRLQVNIALNEDLTCSYRDSKISSCSVEGVVQVQVKTPDGGFPLAGEGGDQAASVPPFALAVRDASGHVKSVQENRKYADGFATDEAENDIDRRFIVVLPKAGAYFPVMKYKCTSELRPVPIRVQTRVRMHGIFCRVALQISSNPANEDDLTDLTIIMAVPPNVRGETLVTSPSGGVWNPSKRSVLWCVAELGEGEKFQLQAQFEMDSQSDNAEAAGGGRPSFPVLVRCQCMYAQLSDVELEVWDVPELCPADVTMKLARRFRLSHRERS